MIIEMKHVSFVREDRVILDRIHWSVQENEQWVILGLNGSGKTSLLNILLGYEYPSKGEVSVLGHRFGKTNLPELRKHIGFVSSAFERFQSTLESETVEEVIVSGKFASIGLYEPVTDADFQQAEQWMDTFRIGYLKGKTFRTLSQGEKRKVLIARALMAKPKLLILDEPTVGLDMLTREELLALIKDVIMKKVCHVLYVTHYIEEIIEEMTHVLLLKDGKMVAAGPKEKILTDDYLSETFQINLHVRWEHNRPWVSIKNSPTLQRLEK